MGDLSNAPLINPYAPRLGGQKVFRPNGREPELSGLRAQLTPPLIAHVDDEMSFLELMSLIVEMIGGYRYVGFEDGDDILAFCQETRPALLITDIMRPGMGGFELCQLLHNDPKLFDLPVIVLSAYAPRDIYKRLSPNDAIFISKPCSPGEVLNQIDIVIREEGLHVPARNTPDNFP